jgi:hypothetical protein
MSEAIRSTDAPEADSSAIDEGEGRVRGAAAREALAELGDRARSVVEELARHARERREAAAARAAEAPSASAMPASPSEEAMTTLPQRLGEIRAYMGEVADVLEATIERLETVEQQLGDPDENIERQLAEGIARCERVLMGIEHRVGGAVTGDHSPAAVRAVAPAPAVPEAGPVLVLSRSSRRRAELCIAVERQGLFAVAAHDLASALRTAARTLPRVALLDLAGSAAERACALEEWKDYEERGVLPPAAAIGNAEPGGSREGFEIVWEEHGPAAMAAVLIRLVRRETGPSGPLSASPPVNE